MILRGAGYYITALVVETVWGVGGITMGRGDLNPGATEGKRWVEEGGGGGDSPSAWQA